MFDADDSLDNCAACDLPLGEPLCCYACYRSLCSGCAVHDQADDVLCPECAGDMGAFLADGDDQVEEVA